MRQILLFLLMSYTGSSVMAENNLKNGKGNLSFEIDNVISKDSSLYPGKNNVLDVDSPRVIISNGDNGLEFSPLSSFNNGLLIQPINRANNSGLPTAFYLSDTTSWSFYTDGKQRLSISGTGFISTSAPLLINNAESDNNSSLRVNGHVRVDSSIRLQASSDTNGFISLHRDIKNVNMGEDDGYSPYTTTPTAWANGNNIPVFRIRHPRNVTGNSTANSSIRKDFLIVPYEYGMAIEYNGVVECWVGEWSIHKGFYYNHDEGNNNGWGAIFWVGDDIDGGGIRATARNNTTLGGNVFYGELSVEKFPGTPHGDFRFRLPSTDNQFHFVYGGRGSTNIVAKVSDKGFFLPNTSADSIATPERGQIFFDSAQSKFKGYDGVGWKNLADSVFNGNLPAGELTVEKFDGSSNGDLLLRLPSVDNQFKFVYGEKGSTNIVAKVSDKGFFLPNTSADSIATPEKGQIFFDSAQSKFKGYDGVGWKDLANDMITGHTDSSANGTDSVYKIAHGLSVKPSYFNVLATSIDAANISYATADDTYIYIYYTAPPAAGTDNLSWNWQIKR